MYKTKDKEGRKTEKKKRRSWGSRRSSYRQRIRQQRSKQATVQIGLPGKVRDLCQICNWARTVTVAGWVDWTGFCKEEERAGTTGVRELGEISWL